MSRTALDGFPLQDVEKDFMLDRIKRLSALYFAEILGFCIMENHFHLIVKMIPEYHFTDEDVQIKSDPAIMMGKPIIAGTRLTFELILEKLAAGETVEQILDAHPRLTRRAIQEALAFAARALKADVV